jgi:hypothetical protein
MLDVLKDTGWPEALEKSDLGMSFLDRELSKRNLSLAILLGPARTSLAAYIRKKLLPIYS